MDVHGGRDGGLSFAVGGCNAHQTQRRDTGLGKPAHSRVLDKGLPVEGAERGRKRQTHTIEIKKGVVKATPSLHVQTQRALAAFLLNRDCLISARSSC